jgi:hypothetical protein
MTRLRKTQPASQSFGQSTLEACLNLGVYRTGALAEDGRPVGSGLRSSLLKSSILEFSIFSLPCLSLPYFSLS